MWRFVKPRFSWLDIAFLGFALGVLNKFGWLAFAAYLLVSGALSVMAERVWAKP